MEDLRILPVVPAHAFVFKPRQNKSPFAIALGDWFLLKTYVLTSKASPNDSRIVIIVIIIAIGEAKLVLHMGGIIAQTVYLAESFASDNLAKEMQQLGPKWKPMGDADVRRV